MKRGLTLAQDLCFGGGVNDIMAGFSFCPTHNAGYSLLNVSNPPENKQNHDNIDKE